MLNIVIGVPCLMIEFARLGVRSSANFHTFRLLESLGKSSYLE